MQYFQRQHLETGAGETIWSAWQDGPVAMSTIRRKTANGGNEEHLSDLSGGARDCCYGEAQMSPFPLGLEQCLGSGERPDFHRATRTRPQRVQRDLRLVDEVSLAKPNVAILTELVGIGGKDSWA